MRFFEKYMLSHKDFFVAHERNKVPTSKLTNANLMIS